MRFIHGITRSELDNVPSDFIFVSASAPVSSKQETKFDATMLGSCAVLRHKTQDLVMSIGDGARVEPVDSFEVVIETNMNLSRYSSPDRAFESAANWRYVSEEEEDSKNDVRTAIM